MSSMNYEFDIFVFCASKTNFMNEIINGHSASSIVLEGDSFTIDKSFSTCTKTLTSSSFD